MIVTDGADDGADRGADITRALREALMPPLLMRPPLRLHKARGGKMKT